MSDIGNFEHIAFQDNLKLEMTLAGAWISAVIWIIILFLMAKERHHLRAHLTDESMWGGGSDYGPGSVRSGKSRLVLFFNLFVVGNSVENSFHYEMLKKSIHY